MLSSQKYSGQQIIISHPLRKQRFYFNLIIYIFTSGWISLILLSKFGVFCNFWSASQTIKPKPIQKPVANDWYYSAHWVYDHSFCYFCYFFAIQLMIAQIQTGFMCTILRELSLAGATLCWLERWNHGWAQFYSHLSTLEVVLKELHLFWVLKEILSVFAEFL